MAEEQLKKEQEQEQEQEIDLLELAHKLWQSRRKLLIWTLGGLIVGAIVAFSIPKEYSVSVKLAPESLDGKQGGFSGGLAFMRGICGGESGADAVYPQLYPDVVSSTPFTASLFDIRIADKDKKQYTVKQYVKEELRSPWWSVIMSLPFKALGALTSSGKEADEKKLDAFNLTQEQNSIKEALNQRIGASVDTKTQVITLTVTMQDPVVAAVLADTVTSRLKEYITDYRTNKAREDLEYAIKLNDEARDNYFVAQQRYADYQDRNQGLVRHSAQTTQARLQNEAQLAFSLYNQTAQQLQKAEAEVQAQRPVFTTVEPATVPQKASKPSKMMILIGFAFLAFVAQSAWILYGKNLVAGFRASEKKA